MVEKYLFWIHLILIFRYKKRLFGSNWREGILTLHEDSTGRFNSVFG